MSECLLLGAGYGEVVFKRDERVVHMGREKIAAQAMEIDTQVLVVHQATKSPHDTDVGQSVMCEAI